MEPRDRAAQEVRPDALRSRVRLGAACVLLVGLAMAQSPGLLVADTKLDLAIGPAGFLARATHLWDPVAAAGQLQNQAYGYLFPMGPFFLLGSLADVPGWAVQRLWLALVLCVAFLGVVRLARALGRPLRPRARAVRVRVRVVPADAHHPGPDLRRGMARCPGAVGAGATGRGLGEGLGATCGGPVSRGGGTGRRGQRRGRVRGDPLGGAVAAHAEPGSATSEPDGLVARVHGCWAPSGGWCRCSCSARYSPPFLDWIESASNTTFSTTLFDTLRGTSNWVPYVDPGSRAGNDLIRLFYLPIDSGVVLLLGLVGLLHRRNPHRGFLSLGVLLGMLMVSAGHLGSVQGWGAAGVQDLLDGMLAPLRNVHKFDPVLRLPLVLGFGWVVDDAAHRLSALRGGRPRPRRAGPTATASGGARYRGAGGAGDVIARPHRAPDACRWTGGGPGLLEADGRLAGGAIGPGPGPAGAGVVVRRIRLGVAARRADAVHGAQPLEHPQRRATGPRRQRQDARRDRGTARAGEGVERARGVPPAGRGGVPRGPQRPRPAAGHPRSGARAPGPGRVARPGAGRVLRPQGRRRGESHPARRAHPGQRRLAVLLPGGRGLSGAAVARRSRCSPSVPPRSSVGPRTCWTSPTSACSTTGRQFWPPTYAGETRRHHWCSPTDSARWSATSAACTTAPRPPSWPGNAVGLPTPHADYLLPDADRWSTWAVQDGAACLRLVLVLGRHGGWDHPARPAPVRRGRRPGGHVLAGELPDRRARLVAAPAGPPPRTA